MRIGSVSRGVLRRALIGVGMLVASPAIFAQSDTGNPNAACAAKNESDTAKVGQFVFRSYRNVGTGDDCLKVLLNGKVVFRKTAGNGGAFTLGQPLDPDENIPAVANGTDLTGRGRPDMIVSEYTGGAHCCTSHMIFELEPEFKLLATLNDADDDMAHFERIGADRRYYYLTADWTFAYWPTCFACSPSALVTLRFVDDAKGSGFHLALDEMRTPAPKPEEWNKELAVARKAVSANAVDDIGHALWGTALNLIYGGHSDLAWKFVDEAGPKAQQKPFPALADFCSLLKRSSYWADLQPTLKDTPPACANAEAVANQ